jgi:predicted dehydrogenase
MTIRWGIVGTGIIAHQLAPMMQIAHSAELAAVSSRNADSAKEFAGLYGIEGVFDSWARMIESPSVDAIYVATPTSVREEICLAAADHGKHVLGEKPFASLASLQRITSACRRNGVGFMDGTHFVHHPRTAHIKAGMREGVGLPWSVDSAFQLNLSDRGNIRFDPDLEPLGAIGDAGWYNMRAAVEYLAPEAEIREVSSFIRRDTGTGAVISGSGILQLDDGSTTTWNCGFDSGALIMDLRISGSKGAFILDDFLSNRPDGPAAYTWRSGGFGQDGVNKRIEVVSANPGAVLMFENFAAMITDPDNREQSILFSEKTQRWLDAIWNEGLQNEL